MYNKKINKIVKKIEQIPTLPIISNAIQTLLYQDDLSFQQIGKIVEQDPPLALKILKIANSSFYGFLNKVSSIDHALFIIGLDELKNVILGFSIQNFFSKTNSNFDCIRFWKHSIICSQIAKFLTKHFKIVDDNTFFISGLVHDIGKLVIEQYMPEEFEKILNYISDKKTTFSLAEKKIIGTTHYQIAAKLLQQWQLPKKITSQVFYHHAPWHDKYFSQGSILVYLSNILTKLAGYKSFEKEGDSNIDDILTPSVLEFVNKNGFELDNNTFKILIENINEFISSESNNILKLFE